MATKHPPVIELPTRIQPAPIPTPGGEKMKPTATEAICRRTAILGLMVLLIPSLGGCGYTVRPPFDRSIKRVYVGMFKSQSFRRDMNIELTEMVQKEIRLRTPYMVVGTIEESDARLEGTITFVDKNVQVENPNNLPRHLLATMQATVTYIDNRSKTSTTKKTSPVVVGEMAPFYPEIGETASLGFQKALQKMAKDIVSMMEEPWGPEYREDIDAAPFDPDNVPIDAPRRRPGANLGAKIPATGGTRR